MTSNERKILGIENEDDAKNLRDMVYSMSLHLGKLTGLYESQEQARREVRLEHKEWQDEVRLRLDAVPEMITSQIDECRKNREELTKPAIIATEELTLLSKAAAKVVAYVALAVGAVYTIILIIEQASSRL